ncbi:adenylyltransferase/cytidyltransferase family protein [Demequina sp. NBRC 110051]|uniref:adenylyltransferase/cytidyltransferase family protein n=1 Tax=Demequina sp. NBRC 110051 TaxID=1570340 RepID=UPI000A071BF8|nr:adenylyltransferase/cytidyltransferase family protein [Demequina sp. NBRC 110051]
MKRVITFGTFDVFHIGHVNMLLRAAELGDHLTVGVSSDELNFSKKQRYPVYRQEHRMGIVQSLACVDNVFVEESLELKGEYIKQYEADVLVMGDDWAGKFDYWGDLCEVVYLPRTAEVSTTDIIQSIREDLG